MARVFGLRVKTYSYLIDEGSENKIVIGTKKYVIKRSIKFENYQNCLKVTQLKNKINPLAKIKLK